MIERPGRGRAVIRQNFNSLHIEIPTKRNWFVIIFLCFWLCGWFAGEAFALVTLLTDAVPLPVNLFLLVWLIFWTLGGGVVLYIILRQLAGKEIIEVEGNLLKIKNSVFDLGRLKQYEIREIRNLTLNSAYLNPTNNWSFGKTRRYRNRLHNGALKFDYGMSVKRFAAGIEEAEARMILGKFKNNPNFNRENFAPASEGDRSQIRY